MVPRANKDLRRNNFVGHGKQIRWKTAAVLLRPASGRETNRDHVVSAAEQFRSMLRMVAGTEKASRTTSQERENNVARAHGMRHVRRCNLTAIQVSGESDGKH